MTKETLVLGLLAILVVTLTACGSDVPTEQVVDAAEVGGSTPASGAADPTAVPEVGDPAPTDTPTTPAEAPPSTASTLDDDYEDALPVFMQLVIGTMLLEETPDGVTAEQAQQLLPLWQMFRAVRRGDSPPSLEEIDAITGQIVAAMTPEQLGAIKAMALTQEDSKTFTQENKITGGNMGSGGDTMNLSDEERRMRMITGGGKPQVDELIRRLEMWAG